MKDKDERDKKGEHHRKTQGGRGRAQIRNLNTEKGRWKWK